MMNNVITGLNNNLYEYLIEDIKEANNIKFIVSFLME